MTLPARLFLLLRRVPFPEDAARVALDSLVGLGEGQALFGPEAVLPIELDPAKAATEFPGRDRGRAGAEEGIEDDAPGRTAREDQFGQEFFGFLRGMIGVLGHGPVGDRDVVPEIRGTGVAEAPVVRFFPVLREAGRAVGRDHPPPEFHGLEVEIPCVPDRGEPDVFGAVFPVGARAPALLPLPGDAVPDVQAAPQDGPEGNRGLPVSADVDRGLGFEEGQGPVEPGFRIGFIVGVTGLAKGPPVEILREVIRGIDDEEVNEGARQVGRDPEKIGVDGSVKDGFGARPRRDVARAEETAPKGFRLFRLEGQRSVPARADFLAGRDGFRLDQRRAFLRASTLSVFSQGKPSRPKWP